MDAPMSEARLSTQLPLTAQEQWENFTAHHCGKWRGVLLRYDGAGHLVDVLDSIRSFTLAKDRLTVTHELDFRSRMSQTVMQKQWIVKPGNPLVAHPVDPNADLLFSQNFSGIMIGQNRLSPSSFYFEPYLVTEGKRISLVVIYAGANSAKPNRFSLFREIKEGAAAPWWSAATQCAIAPIPHLLLPASTTAAIHTDLEKLNQRAIALQQSEIQGDFLQFQFPDAVNLVVSHDRFATPYHAALSWTPASDQAPKLCALTYRQSQQQAEVLTA